MSLLFQVKQLKLCFALLPPFVLSLYSVIPDWAYKEYSCRFIRLSYHCLLFIVRNVILVFIFLIVGKGWEKLVWSEC